MRKTETTTRYEDIEVLYRPPWLLPESVFKPRAKECDAKDFWDTDTTQVNEPLDSLPAGRCPNGSFSRSSSSSSAQDV